MEALVVGLCLTEHAEFAQRGIHWKVFLGRHKSMYDTLRKRIWIWSRLDMVKIEQIVLNS